MHENILETAQGDRNLVLYCNVEDTLIYLDSSQAQIGDIKYPITKPHDTEPLKKGHKPPKFGNGSPS